MIREEMLNATERQPTQPWLSAMAARVALLLGILVMFGWFFRIEILKSVYPGQVAMQFNTAVLFTLTGGALWFLRQNHPPPAARLLAHFGALTAIAIGSATLYEYLSGHNLGIDQFLFRENTPPIDIYHPGRMSPHTAINFILAGFALLSLDVQCWRQYPAQWATIGILFIALLALIGKTYRLPSLYAMTPFTGMALNTALGFLVLGFGILFARPRQGLAALWLAPGSGGAMTRRLLPAAVLIPVLLSWLAMQLSERYGSTSSELWFAMVITLTIMSLTASIWRIGHLLNTLDAERQQALAQLRQANARLDLQVVERTAQLAEARDSAELDRLLEQLSAERALLDTVLQSAPVGIGFFDQQLRFQLVNDRLARITGLPPEEHLGKTVEELLPNFGLQTRQVLRQVMETGEPVVNHEFSGKTHSDPGLTRYWSISWYPVRHEDGDILGAGAIVEEITERKRNEQALQESEARFRNMADHAPVMIWMTAADGTVSYCNRQWHDFTGTLPGQGSKAGWFEQLHVEDHSMVAVTFETARQQCQPFRVESRLRRHDGEYRWVLGSAMPRVDEHQQYLGHIGSLMDISERKEQEQALQVADAHKNQFLAVLGHELRNPLAPITHAVQVVRLSVGSGPNAERALNIVEHQVEHLSRLVDDLLDISRIAQGKLEFRKQPVELATIVERAIEIIQPMIGEQEQTLELLMPNHPVWIEADMTRLTQAIGNILSNAVKYTPLGGHIILDVECTHRLVELRIRDNGNGIPAELLPHVFELFVQKESSSPHSAAGLGIGLALARQLIERHGGNIEAYSAGLNQGSEFRVRLPVLAMENPPVQ